MSDSSDNILTIVVNTCDSYADVLDIFFCAFKNFWPDCPYSVVINAQSRTYSHPAQVHLHSGSGGADDWGGRLQATLLTIDSEFVLMLYDDFILEAPVSTERVRQALALLRRQANAVVAYLVDKGLPLSLTNLDEVFLPLQDRIDYRLNSAPAIWRKKALLDYTEVGDNPWAWEVFGTYRTWGDGRIFYSLNPRKSDIYPFNHKKGGAIYRGKWVREVVEQVVDKYPLDIDWDKRGFSSDSFLEKRPFIWKLRFMQMGFRMVGIKSFYFLISYVLSKFYVRKK